MTHHRANLIVSPIGDMSVHRTWLVNESCRNFDLLLIYYGSQGEFGRGDADYYFRQQGFKWELLTQVMKQAPEIISRYRNIWCPDNDIAADTASVNRLFDVFDEYRLQLAQPAVAAGEVSYRALRKRPGVLLRYTPYVEVMCPLFTREALAKVSHTFGENRSGWGLDWVWPRYFADHERAIIDAVGVHHTGPLFRGEHYQSLARLGIHPDVDFQQVMKKYGGFDRRLHRRFVKGKVRLPAIWDPAARRSPIQRAIHRLGFRRRLA